jgi:hypothetical protein
VDQIKAFWSQSIDRSSAPDVLRRVRDNEIKIAVGIEGLSVGRYREIERLAERRADVREAIEGRTQP